MRKTLLQQEQEIKNFDEEKENKENDIFIFSEVNIYFPNSENFQREKDFIDVSQLKTYYEENN